jgi:hypothetical protein
VGTAVAQSATSFARTPLFEGLARAGYATRGVLYAIIGVLAYRLTEGRAAEPASQQGALVTISEQPFGRLLLVLTAVGLAGYALWRFLQAIVGVTPEAGRHSALDRLAAVGSGAAYATFCVLAVSIIHDSSAASDSPTPRELTAKVLDWSFGRELVGAVGLVFLIMGVYEVYLAVTRRFCDDSKVIEMTAPVRRAFVWIGVVGLLARAVVFSLIGFFIVRAAVRFDPKEAVGLDGALGRVLAHEHGTLILSVVAIGLIVFGVYSLADARYRKI